MSQVTNYNVAGDELYLFGGWKKRSSSEAAWSALFALDLPVPILEGTIGAQLMRRGYKYSPKADAWTRLADTPQHMAKGSSVVLRDRYIVMLGSTHGANSFRVGVDEPGDAVAHGGPIGGNPDMRLPPSSGIVTYYGDTVTGFDTVTGKYSRIGKLVCARTASGFSSSHCALIRDHCCSAQTGASPRTLGRTARMYLSWGASRATGGTATRRRRCRSPRSRGRNSRLRGCAQRVWLFGNDPDES